MSKKRDFKGVWIPKEIYLNDDLSWTEKILLIEIDSLDNEKGCFAKNKYFADFLGKSENWISQCISKLKDKGFIYESDFDGRRRVLRSRLGYGKKQSNQVEYEKTQRQGLGKTKGRVLENSKADNEENGGNYSSKGQKSPSINTVTKSLNNFEEEEAPALQEIGKRYKQLFNRELSADFLEKLLSIYTDTEIILKALEVAEYQGDKPIYLLKLLADWQQRGLKSVAEVDAYLENRKARTGSYGPELPDLNDEAKKLHNIEELEKRGWN